MHRSLFFVIPVRRLLANLMVRISRGLFPNTQRDTVAFLLRCR
jgi:hypothetical protein